MLHRKLLQDFVVLLVLIGFLRTSKLWNWRNRNFKCVEILFISKQAPKNILWVYLCGRCWHVVFVQWQLYAINIKWKFDFKIVAAALFGCSRCLRFDCIFLPDFWLLKQLALPWWPSYIRCFLRKRKEKSNANSETGPLIPTGESEGKCSWFFEIWKVLWVKMSHFLFNFSFSCWRCQDHIWIRIFETKGQKKKERIGFPTFCATIYCVDKNWYLLSFLAMLKNTLTLLHVLDFSV